MTREEMAAQVIKQRRRYTTLWNRLPHRERHIANMAETSMRINQLESEKQRLTKQYRKSIAECNDHIKNLADWIRKDGVNHFRDRDKKINV